MNEWGQLRLSAKRISKAQKRLFEPFNSRNCKNKKSKKGFYVRKKLLLDSTRRLKLVQLTLADPEASIGLVLYRIGSRVWCPNKFIHLLQFFPFFQFRPDHRKTFTAKAGARTRSSSSGPSRRGSTGMGSSAATGSSTTPGSCGMVSVDRWVECNRFADSAKGLPAKTCV